MLARLAVETRCHHVQIDELLLWPLSTPTRGAYRHFIARLYGFEAPLATSLRPHAGLGDPLAGPRVRASWLAADLLQLGLTAVESQMLRVRHDVPRFSSPADALGWLYVSERLTLRGGLVRTRLVATIPEVIDTAGQYLATVHECGQPGWRELGALLDHAAHRDGVADRIVAAAHAAFASQRAWLEATAWDGF